LHNRGPPHGGLFFFEMDDSIIIEKLAYGGFGIGTSGGKKFFIPYTVPGERVSCRITGERKNFAWAEIVRLETASRDRRLPPCPYFGVCGGCQWQHIDYAAQTVWKERVFKETLARLGGVNEEVIQPIAPSPEPFGYRQRVTLQVQKGRLGYFSPNSNSLVKVDQCLVAHPLINKAVTQLQGKLAPFPVSQVEIAASPDQPYIMAHVRLKSPPARRDLKRLSECMGQVADIRSLLVEFPRGESGVSFTGEPFENAGLEFNLEIPGAEGNRTIGFMFLPGVFIQVHWPQNIRMVRRVLSVAERFGKKLNILELHAGAGNFTLPLAAAGHSLYSVERSKRAVANGLYNLEKNGIEGAKLFRKSSEEALESLAGEGRTFDLVVADPPRAGLKKELGHLLNLQVPGIIYISCDPATLSRDLKILTQNGYDLEQAQPFDFFPQTYHVESMSVLTRRN
jgi:23S rRNA (uracil1939-C5)-methyltransferase